MKSPRLLLGLACLLGALLTAAPAAAVEPGVVIAGNSGGRAVDEYAQTSAAKARWVRLWLDWSVAEPADNSYSAVVADVERRVREFNKRGVNVLLVALYSPSWQAAEKTAPPRDAGKYAEFVGDMAARFDGQSGRPLVKAWEIWNEPDDHIHWRNGPQPEVYANLLKAAYPAVKRGNPGAKVITGGMVGNNFDFLSKLYAYGAKGYFDAVGTHTDTACLRAAPDFYYREPDGRIGRFSFTGYRETRQVMLANGDPKPIWFTEIGWSTSPGKCHVPGRESEPAGVSLALQAEYLRHAYECLEADDYVEVALWFSLQDVSSSLSYDHQLGLIDNDGAPKPAFAAFQSIADARQKRSCGVQVDASAPRVTLVTPLDGQQYADTLRILGTATDDVKVDRMELQVDGKKILTKAGGKFDMTWYGARELSMGKHTLTLMAYDDARNIGRSTITIVKDLARNITVEPATLTAKATRRPGRKLLISGRVAAPANAAVVPRGQVRAYLYLKRGKRWKKSGSYGSGISKPFRFAAKFRRAGRWKVVIRYDAEAPYKSIKLPPKYYRVR